MRTTIPDDPSDLIDRFSGAQSILTDAQFSSEDVCRVAGINAKQLEHAIDPKRSILSLSTHVRERVQGKRRFFTGADILKVRALFVSNAIGFPQRWAGTFADQIAFRASARLSGVDRTPNLAIAAWPMKDGDWATFQIHDNLSVAPKLPIACHFIQVDRLIDETLAVLRAIVVEEEIPNFAVPDPVPEPSPYSPENDFFLAWTKDDEGRDVNVGLNFQETAIFEKYTKEWIASGIRPIEGRKQFHELQNRHEAARMKRVGEHLSDQSSKRSTSKEKK